MPYTRDQFVREYYGANDRRAAIRDEYDRKQAQMRMAEMGAARFEAIGGEQGEYWANAIRQDPHAAMGMAEQYGGLGEIEAILLNSRAQAYASREMREIQEGVAGQGGGSGKDGVESGTESQAPPANGRQMYDFILRSQGPEAAKNFAEGYKIVTETDQERDPAPFILRERANRKTLKGADGYLYYADTLERVLPHIDKTKDKRDIVKDRLGRSRYADTGEFVFADDENAGEEPRFDFQRIDSLRRARQPLINEARKQEQAIAQWESTDWMDNPANDAKLVKMFVQQVEPGLQVTSAEGDAVAVAATSGAGNLTQKIIRTFAADGTFTNESRKLIMDSIRDSLKARSATIVSQFDGIEAENRDFFGDDERAARESLAGIGSSVENIRKFVSEAGAQASPDEYQEAVRTLKAQGFPDEALTPEVIADMLEAAKASEAPKAGKPDMTVQELMRAAGMQ